MCSILLSERVEVKGKCGLVLGNAYWVMHTGRCTERVGLVPRTGPSWVTCPRQAWAVICPSVVPTNLKLSYPSIE